MNIMRETWQRNCKAFIVTICVGAVIHFPIYSNNLMNPDGIWMGEEYIASWEVMSGRWGREIFDRLHAGVNTPILVALVALVFFSLGGVLLNECFKVEEPWIRLLVPLCIVSSPLVSFTLTYPFCSDSYGCAFFLAVFSMFLAEKGETPLWAAAAVACLAYSLGVYQSNIGVSAGVALLILFLRLMERPDDLKCHKKRFLKFLMIGIGGITAYWLILKLALWSTGWELSSYKGASSISLLGSIKSFPTSAVQAYTDFFDFFARRNIMINSYLTKFCYGVLFLAFLTSFLLTLISFRRRPISILAACLLLGLLPLACNVLDIVAPQTTIMLLTSGGMAVVCPAVLAFCAKRWERNGKAEEHKAVKWGQLAIGIVAVVLIWNNALIVGTDAMVMESNTRQTIAVANRILIRLEQNEDYLAGVPMVIAGVPQNGNYPIVSTLTKNANQYASWGLTWGTYDGTMNCWRQIFRQLLGVEPSWCWDENKYRDIAATQEFQDMPLFPAEGSIQTINDFIVVKISNMDG